MFSDHNLISRNNFLETKDMFDEGSNKLTLKDSKSKFSSNKLSSRSKSIISDFDEFEKNKKIDDSQQSNQSQDNKEDKNSVLKIENMEIKKSSENPSEQNLENKENLHIYSDTRFPIEDYKGLSLYDQLIYDDRTFIEFLRDCITKDHIILNLFFKKSLFTPQYIRIIKVTSMVTFMFGLNAILYSDNDIRQRAQLAAIKQEFYSDIPKSLYSYLICLCMTYLLSFIIWKPNHLEELLMKAIKTKNTLIIPGIQ